MATEKNKKYADLIVPFLCCPFEKVEDDCPFSIYWTGIDFDQMLVIIDQLSDDNLQNLQEHHYKCLQKKINRGEDMVNL